MADVAPQGRSQPVVLGFTLDVTDEWRDRQVDLTGERPPKTWQVVVDLKDVDDPELRRRLRLLHAGLNRVKFRPMTAAPPSGDPAELASAIETWLQITGLEADAMEDSAVRFALERRDWVEAHGSPRLRAAAARGYKTNRLYAVERAAIEYPDFYVDTNSSAQWQERVDPSVEALAIETDVLRRVEQNGHAYRPRIVWLQQPPSELQQRLAEQAEPWEQQEAIRIHGYLRRYELYLPVDPHMQKGVDDEME